MSSAGQWLRLMLVSVRRGVPVEFVDFLEAVEVQQPGSG